MLTTLLLLFVTTILGLSDITSAAIHEYHHQPQYHHEQQLTPGHHEQQQHYPSHHDQQQQFAPHQEHHDPYGDKSVQFKAQDVYGNYGFGYQTHTIKGDGDYRYERKSGGHTEGAYGFSNDGGRLHQEFFQQQPHSPYVPTYYDAKHHPMDNVIHDIPPAAAVHIPTVHVHPLEGMPLERGQLQAAASDVIERSNGHTPYAGPRYHSYYDVNIPNILYAASGFLPQPSLPSLSNNHLSDNHHLSNDPEHHASLLHDNIDDNHHLTHHAGPSQSLPNPYEMHQAYMSFIDKLMPSIPDVHDHHSQHHGAGMIEEKK